MYYADLRSEEAVAVALVDCRLPRTGWGRLIVHCALPQVGKKWTDTGRLRGESGLKSRPLGAIRMVPLSTYFVALWRESVATFGTVGCSRGHHRIVSQAVVIATGISATGHCEILGLMVGDSESRRIFPRSRSSPNRMTSIDPAILALERQRWKRSFNEISRRLQYRPRRRL
jgi:hypothetical protein